MKSLSKRIKLDPLTGKKRFCNSFIKKINTSHRINLNLNSKKIIKSKFDKNFRIQVYQHIQAVTQNKELEVGKRVSDVPGQVGKDIHNIDEKINRKLRIFLPSESEFKKS